MDHHLVNSPPSPNPRKLNSTATPPRIAETSLAVTCHLLPISSAAANMSHAVPAMHNVSMCSPAQPLSVAKENEIRQLTANNKPASAHGENLMVRVMAIHATTIVIDKRLIQPRELPVANVPVPASVGYSTSEHNDVKVKAALKLIASNNCSLIKLSATRWPRWSNADCQRFRVLSHGSK